MSELDTTTPAVARALEFASEGRRGEERYSYDTIINAIAAMPAHKRETALRIGEQIIGYQLYWGTTSDDIRSRIDTEGKGWVETLLADGVDIPNLKDLNPIDRIKSKASEMVTPRFDRLWDASKNLAASPFRDAIDPILGIGKGEFDFSAADAYAIGYAYTHALDSAGRSEGFAKPSIFSVFVQAVKNLFTKQEWNWDAAKTELTQERLPKETLREEFISSLETLGFGDKAPSIAAMVTAQNADGTAFDNDAGGPLFAKERDNNRYANAVSVFEDVLPDTSSMALQRLGQTAKENPGTALLAAAAWHKIKPVRTTIGLANGLRGQQAGLISSGTQEIRDGKGVWHEQRNATRSGPFFAHNAQRLGYGINRTVSAGANAIGDFINPNVAGQVPVLSQATRLRAEAAMLDPSDPRRATLEALADGADREAARNARGGAVNPANVADNIIPSNSTRRVRIPGGPRGRIAAIAGTSVIALGSVIAFTGDSSAETQDDDEKERCDNEVCQILLDGDTRGPLALGGAKPTSLASTDGLQPPEADLFRP